MQWYTYLESFSLAFLEKLDRKQNFFFISALFLFSHLLLQHLSLYLLYSPFIADNVQRFAPIFSLRQSLIKVSYSFASPSVKPGKWASNNIAENLTCRSALSSPLWSPVLFSAVSVLSSQLWLKNIKRKLAGVNNLQTLNCALFWVEWWNLLSSCAVIPGTWISPFPSVSVLFTLPTY